MPDRDLYKFTDKHLLSLILEKLEAVTDQAEHIQTTQLNLFQQLIHNQEKIMALIDDLEAKAAAQTTVDDSIIQLLTTVHDELVAANANNPRVQAVIDMLGNEQTRIASAVTANTDQPAPPPSPPAPPPPTPAP